MPVPTRVNVISARSPRSVLRAGKLQPYIKLACIHNSHKQRTVHTNNHGD